MAANCSHLTDAIAPAVALTELFTTHPELTPESSGLTWSLTPSGDLHAELRDAVDGGRAMDQCAEVMGATPVRATGGNGPDRVVLATLAAEWHGVPVEVWETYRAPEAPLPLGVLVVLPGGDQ